jgi:TolB-like protein
VDPQEVAKNLGVDAIVTGRISQLGNNFVLNVELINAHDRSQIWGKQFQVKSSDLLLARAEFPGDHEGTADSVDEGRRPAAD